MHSNLPRAAAFSKEEKNLKGWESVAENWAKVGWPRRPRWNNEFDKAQKFFSKMDGKEALVMGATPEFRAWLTKAGARVSLYEKSPISLAAMSSILKEQFAISPKSEMVIPYDWESAHYDKKRYTLAMGDLVSGYLETPERFHAFLSKINEMLVSGGVFLLREFVNEPTDFPANRVIGADYRRWAYVLTPGFAIEKNIFYEEKLAYNLAKINDKKALATCANPPRTRLMPDYDGFSGMFKKAGFQAELLIPPSVLGPPVPALWALKK